MPVDVLQFASPMSSHEVFGLRLPALPEMLDKDRAFRPGDEQYSAVYEAVSGD